MEWGGYRQKKHHEETLASYSECTFSAKVVSLVDGMASTWMRTWGRDCRTLESVRTFCYGAMWAICVDKINLVLRCDSLSFIGSEYGIPLDKTWVSEHLVGPHAHLFGEQKGEGVSMRLTQYKFNGKLEGLISRPRLLAMFILTVAKRRGPAPTTVTHSAICTVLMQAMVSVRRSVEHLAWARNILLWCGHMLAIQADPVEWGLFTLG